MQNIRAFRSLIWYMTQFCLTHRHTDGRSGSLHGWITEDPKNPTLIGDLVVPTSAGISQWNLSWVKDVIRKENGNIYVLESVETGEIMDWSNIGIKLLEREVVAEHPEWRWTDRQFKFNDRWKRVCHADNDAYFILPLDVVLGEGSQVTFGTRRRMNMGQQRPTKSFPDWRKVTKKTMGETYAYLVKESYK